jgi:hypothetical protein
MNKKTMWTVAVTALIVLILSDKLKALPGLNKLPSV